MIYVCNRCGNQYPPKRKPRPVAMPVEAPICSGNAAKRNGHKHSPVPMVKREEQPTN